jgi:uncharacterized RDD family membrane protein YckC
MRKCKHMNDNGRIEEPEESFPLRYAGFWARFGAALVDALVLAPVTIISSWILSYSREAAIGLVLPLGAVGPAYTVILHARYGQTVGKMAARIGVVRISGAPIGWREALLRSSVEIVFGTIASLSGLVARIQLPEADWTQGWMEKFKLIQTLEPSWGDWAAYAVTVWIWSEVVTMLFNRKRRALHDFIAGTIVVRGYRRGLA